MCNIGHFTHTLTPKCYTKHAVTSFMGEQVLDVASAVCFKTNAGLADSFGAGGQPVVTLATGYGCWSLGMLFWF